jgi:hypothetical protein
MVKSIDKTIVMRVRDFETYQLLLVWRISMPENLYGSPPRKVEDGRLRG